MIASDFGETFGSYIHVVGLGEGGSGWCVAVADDSVSVVAVFDADGHHRPLDVLDVAANTQGIDCLVCYPMSSEIGSVSCKVPPVDVRWWILFVGRYDLGDSESIASSSKFEKGTMVSWIKVKIK